ncbi:MAG TPA: amidohydrolase family protein [Chloroflexota bacterium]|nr:amidohydrolase family protein [Chloroflexota bacterium]
MLVIAGGQLFDGASLNPPRPATVLVEGNQIAAVGLPSEIPVPDSARIIDATGCTVLPGFIDMHVHITLGAGQGNLSLWLANGVTTVRDLGGDPDKSLAVRDEIAAGKRVGPRTFAVGPWLQGESAQTTPPGSPMWVSHDARDARRDVETLLARGVDGLKLYTMLPPKLFAEVLKIVDGRVWTTAHVARTTAQEAISAGVECIEHLYASLYQDVVRPEDRHGPNGGPGATPDYWRWLAHGWAHADLKSDSVQRLVELFASSAASLSPTMVMMTGGWVTNEAADDPGSGFERRPARNASTSAVDSGANALSEEDMGRARLAQLELLGVLYGAGCTILPGTDSPAVPLQVPGFSLHREFALHAEAGIPNAAILQSATRNAAQKLRRGAQLGTIEAGKLADIVIVNGDPVADIRATRAVRYVIKDGVVFTPAELLREVQ